MKPLKGILILLIFLLGMTCSKKYDGAYVFIKGVYSNYGTDGSSFAFNGPRADTIFTPTLLSLIRLDQQLAQGEVGYLDADPICACQDSRGLTVNSINIKNRSDTVFAYINFQLGSENKFLILILENLNDKWHIGDIIDTMATPRSLVQFLSEKLQQQNE